MVWNVHGAWIDGYFLSIILASLRFEHYARYDSENKDKALPLLKSLAGFSVQCIMAKTM